MLVFLDFIFLAQVLEVAGQQSVWQSFLQKVSGKDSLFLGVTEQHGHSGDKGLHLGLVLDHYDG